MRLILVRHGQTTANIGRHLDTAAPGADLSELGRRQAAALPAVLGTAPPAALGTAPSAAPAAGTGSTDTASAGTTRSPIEALYASTLVRTQQTAAPLAAALGLPVVVRDGIREIAAGHLEMRNDDASVEHYLTTVFAWSAGDLDVRMPGGEDGHEVYGRVDEVVAEVAASGVRTAVLVSHAALIRSWCAARVDNISTAHAARHPVSNTGAVVLDGDPRTGWWALSWQDQALGGRDLDSGPAEGAADEPLSPSDGPDRRQPDHR